MCLRFRLLSVFRNSSNHVYCVSRAPIFSKSELCCFVKKGIIIPLILFACLLHICCTSYLIMRLVCIFLMPLCYLSYIFIIRWPYGIPSRCAPFSTIYSLFSTLSPDFVHLIPQSLHRNFAKSHVFVSFNISLCVCFIRIQQVILCNIRFP